MTEEARRLGEPYLKDKQVIFLLAQRWTGGFADSNKTQWVRAAFNDLQNYRKDIKEDFDVHYEIVGVSDRSEWHSKYLERYPYIDDVAESFYKTLKDFYGLPRIVSYLRENVDKEQETFESPFDAYLSAITALSQIIADYDVIMGNIFNLQRLIGSGESKDKDLTIISVLNEYFKPNGDLTDKELQSIVRGLCDKKVQTPTKLKSLNDNFTPRPNYKSLSITQKNKIFAEIFGCKVKTVARSFITYRNLQELKNLR